jgi:hypothetical protein
MCRKIIADMALDEGRRVDGRNKNQAKKNLFRKFSHQIIISVLVCYLDISLAVKADCGYNTLRIKLVFPP